jgi:hypothetical protein
MFSENAVALYLEPGAESVGLRAGDRVTALEGRQVRDRAHLLALLQRDRPGEELEVTVERGGAPHRFVLRCADGRPYADAVIGMQEAADDQRWEDCLNWAAAAERLRVRTAGVAAWGAYCEGERLAAAGSQPTPELAEFVCETLRLAIVEARYDPAGAPAAQPYVETGIAWLRQHGFPDLADELSSHLVDRFGRVPGAEATREVE